MATTRYFGECQGQPVRLANPRHDGSRSSGPRSFEGFCEKCGRLHQATRKIDYKPNPSKHKCDARCIHATGRIMRCECSCGGKHHGRGS